MNKNYNNMRSYSGLLKRAAVCAGLVLSAAIVEAQPATFIKAHGGSGTDSGRYLEFTADGGYITVGHTTTNSMGFADIYVVKTTVNGDVVWEKKYGGSGVEHGFTIERVADGNYIISGRSTSPGFGGEDAYLIKIDENGNLLWEKRYGGSSDDRIEAAYETADGGIIMVGNTVSPPSTSVDVFLIKADANGNQLWTKTFGGAGYDNGNMVQPTTDGGYIIIGQTMSYGQGQGDYWLIKTDSNGDMVWQKTFGGPQVDEGKNIRQTTDGGFIITGDTDSYGSGLSDAYIIKTDGNGEVQWSKVYGGTRKEAAKMIEVMPDGGYVVAAITRSFGLYNPDAWIIKLNSQGDTLWTRYYGGVEHEHLYSMRPDPNGGIVGVGHSDSYGAQYLEQVYLLRLTDEGTLGVDDGERYQINVMNVYPNPTDGPFEVKIDLNGAPKAEIMIMNSNGQVVMQERIESRGEFHKKIDLSHLSKGIYFLGVSVNDRFTTQKITIY